MAIAGAALIAGGVQAAGSAISGYLQYRNAQRQAEAQRARGQAMGSQYDQMARTAGARSRGFAQTSYGEYLTKLSEEGQYGASEEQRMLSGVARQTGTIADQSRQRYLGALASQGLEGSVAGARGVSQIAGQRMQAISSAQQNIQSQESAVQRSAQEAFARGDTETQQRYQSQQDQYRLAAIQSRTGADVTALQLQGAGTQALAQGLTGAASTFAGNWAQGVQAQQGMELLQPLLDAYRANPTTENYNAMTQAASRYGSF